MCAGKPLIGELTENVLKDADAKLKEHFGSLKASGDRPATIEDLINYLVRYRDILGTVYRKNKQRYWPLASNH